MLTGVCGGRSSRPPRPRRCARSWPTEDLPTALAQNQAREHVAGLVGAPIGGALYAVARWLPFAADAVSFAVSWVLLGRIRTDLSPRRTTAASGVCAGCAPTWRAGRGSCSAGRSSARCSVWSALTNLVVNAVFFAAILRLIQGGVDPLHLGLVETAAGVAGIVGAILAPWIIDRFATGWLTVTIAWSFVPRARADGAVEQPAAGRGRRSA